MQDREDTPAAGEETADSGGILEGTVAPPPEPQGLFSTSPSVGDPVVESVIMDDWGRQAAEDPADEGTLQDASADA